MAQKLSVLLVEDEPAEANALRHCFDESNDDFVLVDVTNCAQKAIELCDEYKPDIVILDLELSKGSGSGLDFLSALNTTGDFQRPFIIITTNNTSPIIYNQARAFGADYIIAKYQDGYCAAYVIDFVRKCKPTILSAQKRQASKSHITIETQEQQSDRIQRRLFVEFNQIGIITKLKGRTYLSKAVEYYMRNPQSSIRDVLAKEFGKSPTSVERAMQSAIATTWNTAHPDDLQKYYTAPIRPERGMPSVLEFISYYAQKMQKEN